MPFFACLREDKNPKKILLTLIFMFQMTELLRE